MFEEEFGEEVVGKLSCLLEPIHALGKFVIYSTVVSVSFKTIFINDFLGYYAELDACILWAVERSVEVEVLQVECHEPGI